MQSTTGTLIPRMIGAAKLDAATYEEVEADQSATTQAMIVVAIAAVAGAIGGAGDGIGGIIGGIIASILLWAIFAVIAFYVGTTVLRAPATNATIGEVLRTTGFAYAPEVLAVVGFIPVIGWIVAFIASVWFLVASVVGLQHALEMSIGRTIAVALIAWLPAIIVAGLILALFT